jgi:hypothetical protein
MKLEFHLSAPTIVVVLFHVWSASAQPVFPEAKLVNAKITESGDLEIIPSKTSSHHDFDFLTGKWKMDNQRLKTRLKNSNEWESFESLDENYGPILKGIGNMDIYKATFSGKPMEGLTLRLFNPQTRLWSLYWVASTTGVLDPPVIGSFEGNIGRFYCKDVYQGTPVLVMFHWDKTDKDNPVWSQAFSADNGLTWEWNWTNVSHRMK